MRVTHIVAALIVVSALAAPIPAHGQQEDPNLEQTIADGQPIVHGQRVLTTGHVDMGPRFDEGAWRFLVHDDAARADAGAQSVWRYPDETVFHVLDAARLPVPDDPAYSFVGAEPGAEVWVVPQTQNPDVVWIGWNTQSPDVLAVIDRGITLAMLNARGPGVVTTYLQSGTFGEPQVLWDSRRGEAQPVWVDVNTHTHANWVFTEPGVYLLELAASAELIDGTTVTDTQTIRFAVGSQTDPLEALSVSPGASSPSPAPAAAPAEGAAVDSVPPGAPDPWVPVLIAAIVIVAGGMVTGVVIASARGARTRREVLRRHAEPGEDEEGSA